VAHDPVTHPNGYLHKTCLSASMVVCSDHVTHPSGHHHRMWPSVSLVMPLKGVLHHCHILCLLDHGAQQQPLWQLHVPQQCNPYHVLHQCNPCMAHRIHLLLVPTRFQLLTQHCRLKHLHQGQ